jgi:hypothetical protein
VVKRESFLPTIHKLTPQLKGEKCPKKKKKKKKKKKTSTSYSMRPTHPKEEIKEKEREGRRKHGQPTMLWCKANPPLA